MTQGLDFDDFLGHKASEGGGGFLGNWKEDGSVVVWLHPAAKIYPVWSHRFWRLDTGDAENPLSAHKGTRLNCFEREVILKKQRFRHQDGTREFPPQVCPHCLLIEHVRGLIASGEISWTEPLFRLDTDNGEFIVHAGGFTGQFQRRDLSDQEKREIKQAGASVKEAFRENGAASLEYVFRLIVDAKPGDGCQIATEKQTLGQKLQDAIGKRMDDYEEANETVTNWEGKKLVGRAAGNPANNPCAFKFVYKEDEDFSNKYSVTCFDKKKPSPEVIEQFRQEPPSVERLISAPDLIEYRKVLEQVTLIDIPWDDIFGPAKREGLMEARASMDEDPDDLPTSYGGKAKPTYKVPAPTKPKQPDPEPEDDGMVACDACGKPFSDTEMTCPHCGAEYEEVDGNVQLKPKPEPKKTRRGGKAT